MKTQARTRTAASESAPGVLSGTPRIVDFDVYICYTQSHLIRDGLIGSSITNIKAADLIPSRNTVISGQVSHQAIMSFATILFGIQHRQADITRHGYAMHSVALKQLNHVLCNIKRHSHDEVIVAIAALSISELLVPSGSNNHLTHMMGLERLLDLQDPASFWFKNSSGFCKGVRFMILLAALKLGQPSILAKADWKRAMRTNCSYQELQEQDLFDVLADCSVLLADRDIMHSASDTNSIAASELRDDIERRAHSLLVHTYEWRSRWDAKLENVYREPAESLSGLEESQLIRSKDSAESLVTAATIPNVSAAIMLMLYNIALMRILQITATLAESATGSSSAQIETAHGWHAKERDAAREACRCIQYYLGAGCPLDTSASPIVHWAVAATWSVLRSNDSIEGAWMQDLLSKKGRQNAAEGRSTTYIWLNSLVE
jgi:hypothetical protein